MSTTGQIIKSTRSILAPMLTIVGATAVGVLFVNVFLSAEHQARSIRAEIYGFINWIGGLDVFIATGVGAVIFLIALAFFVRRMA